MYITDVWKAHKKPTLSFELFPARTEKGEINLNKAIDKLYRLEPDFVSVTFGAGGSTRAGSRELIKKLKHEKGFDVMAYFAGYGLGPDEINNVLKDYENIGIKNLLVVRGDPPHDQGSFTPHPDSMAHATDLLNYIKPKFDFCLGSAGYPEGHIDATSKEKDLEILKLKIDNGAEFIIANYFYDNKFFFDFLERIHQAGITVPVIPGIMPIYSAKMTINLAKLCGATIIDTIHNGLAAFEEKDRDGLNAFGIDFAFNQCKELLQFGVPGIHIYTMNRSVSTIGLVTKLKEEGLL